MNPAVGARRAMRAAGTERPRSPPCTASGRALAERLRRLGMRTRRRTCCCICRCAIEDRTRVTPIGHAAGPATRAVRSRAKSSARRGDVSRAPALSALSPARRHAASLTLRFFHF
ncbi:MAG: hypothetical protein MZV65_36365 [Chromatiales bacterium]|nr:hypothetical protein [Chromatiales bacterium]